MILGVVVSSEISDSVASCRIMVDHRGLRRPLAGFQALPPARAASSKRIAWRAASRSGSWQIRKFILRGFITPCAFIADIHFDSITIGHDIKRVIAAA
jgi:hypothetical protein